MSTLQTTERINQAIQAKNDALSAAALIRTWRYKMAAPEGSQSPSAPDGDWAEVTLPYTWSSKDGEAWFRATPAFPSAVERIPLGGCRLELEIMLPIGATVYVNGEERYSEPSWLDTRAVRLLLSDNYQPGEPLSLAVRCRAGDGFGLFLQGILRFSSLEKAIFDLDLARAQIAFTRFLAEKGAAGTSLDAWEEAAAALDLDALAANDWLRWEDSLAAARAALAPFADAAKEYEAHLIAHSHIDMNWLWPWRETVDVCRRDFTAMDRLMGIYEEFYFSQSQAVTYQTVEREYPELFERMRARVAEGRWDVTASTWVEGDLNQSAGESIARHLLHSRRYIGSRLGVEPIICWEPDTFGHNANMPQLLRQSGIKYYYFCRAGKRHPLFWWEGIDGSRLLAVQDLRGYGGTITPGDVTGSVLDFAAPYNLHRGIFLYGAGDHGGGATALDIEAARAIDAAPYLPHARPSTTVGFYQAAEAEAPELPVVRGELNTVFEGCYTSHADIKRINRNGENLLLSAETLSTLAALQTGAADHRADLAEAWRNVCFHQFHDILGGCAIGVTYREARARYEVTEAIANNTAGAALSALATAVDTSAIDGPCLVVFNPLAWQRDAVVWVHRSEWGEKLPRSLVDDTGRRLPVQLSGEEMVFVAEELPALGVRIYRPSDEPAATSTAVAAIAGSNVLDNGVLRVRVHPASGAVDQLIDIAAGRDLAAPWAGWGPEAKVNAGMINRLQILWEQPHPMSAWNIGDITRTENLITGAEVTVVEEGPVRATIEVRRRFLNSSFVQRIVLYRRLRRVDFETTVDWHERGNAHEDAPLLRATFAPLLDQTRASFEIPFAGIERAADGREVPALRWADLSERAEGGYGLSLLNNCKYGHSAQGNTLGLTLLRASYEPDNNPDEGLHSFTYALYPHAGGWEDAGTLRYGAEFNQPARAVVTGSHAGNLQPGQDWLTCAPGNVVVSAVKLAEDQPEAGQAVIVRLYEAYGQAAEAALRPGWPVARAEETDLIERTTAPLTVADGAIRCAFKPHEIKTLKLYTR